jgi:hypothetical protein
MTNEVASRPMFNESPRLGTGALEATRCLTIQNIDFFSLAFSNHQALLVHATALAPTILTQVVESTHIQEVGHLHYK